MQVLKQPFGACAGVAPACLSVLYICIFVGKVDQGIDGVCDVMRAAHGCAICYRLPPQGTSCCKALAYPRVWHHSRLWLPVCCSTQIACVVVGDCM